MTGQQNDRAAPDGPAEGLLLAAPDGTPTFLRSAGELLCRHVAQRHGGVIELATGGQQADLALDLLAAMLSFSPSAELGASVPLISHLKPKLPAGVDCTGARVLRLEGPGPVPRLIITDDPAERAYWTCVSLSDPTPITVLLTSPNAERRGTPAPLLRATLRYLHLTLDHA